MKTFKPCSKNLSDITKKNGWNPTGKSVAGSYNEPKHYLPTADAEIDLAPGSPRNIIFREWANQSTGEHVWVEERDGVLTRVVTKMPEDEP